MKSNNHILFYKLAMVVLLLLHSNVQAEELLLFNTDTQKQQFYTIIDELRCLVCQNQSLADSDAPLALDLKNEVHKMVLQDTSNEDIIKFMTYRYGDFVLYEPPIKNSTLLLWFGPFILAGVALLSLIIYLLRRSDKQLNKPLSADEKRKLSELLNNSK